MQRNVNRLSGPFAVATINSQERIKGCGRIRIQQRVAQPGLAHFAKGEILSLVPRVTESHFPVPRLEIIPKFAHLTAQTNVEELVPVSEFFTSGAGIIGAAEPNTSSHRNWHAVNNKSCVPDCERIKRIRNWHTDTGGTKESVSGRCVEWIRRKRHCRQRRIEERARIFEVGKHRQVLVAQIAGERAVVHLAIS